MTGQPMLSTLLSSTHHIVVPRYDPVLMWSANPLHKGTELTHLIPLWEDCTLQHDRAGEQKSVESRRPPVAID
jgi:hypothetical protein